MANRFLENKSEFERLTNIGVKQMKKKDINKIMIDMGYSYYLNKEESTMLRHNIITKYFNH